MNDLQIIEGTRTYLTLPEHWRQGWYGEPEGPCCLLGAMTLVVSNGETTWFEDIEYYARVLVAAGHLEVPRGFSRVGYADFNDDPQTTHEDVLALLDDAIARLRHA